MKPPPIGAGRLASDPRAQSVDAAVPKGDPNTARADAAGRVGLAPIDIEKLGSRAPHVKIGGIAQAAAQGLSLPGACPSAGQLPSQQGWSSRGHIQATIKSAAGGWEIAVDTHHFNVDEQVNLFLSARIIDPPTESWVVLGTLFAGPMTGTSKDADGLRVTQKKFFVSLDDINAFLLEKAGTKSDGKTPKLCFTPGCPLSVDATWQTQGHECGGRRDQTTGYLVTPALPDTHDVVSIRTKHLPAGSTLRSGEKPLELTLLLPNDLITKYPKVFPAGAKLTSRREGELKLEPRTFEELKTFTQDLIRVAALNAREQAVELARLLGGDGWSLSFTDRYYKKDDGGHYLTYGKGELVWRVKDAKGDYDFDFEGLPKVAGMFDRYRDSVPAAETSGFDAAKVNAAIRFRDGEIKAGEVRQTIGKFQVKPGGGVTDPESLITFRHELSLDTHPGIDQDPQAVGELESFLDNAPAPFNPMEELRKVDGRLTGSCVKQTVVENLAQRYKFTLRHSSGLEVEISNDFFEIVSRHPSLQAPSTRGMSIDERYGHWRAEFHKAGLRFDSTPGAKNVGTFAEYTGGGHRLIDVTVEVSIDEDGNKHVTEQLTARAVQIEAELEHVQCFASGPVQPAVAAAKEATAVASVADEERIFAAISDDAVLFGPPSIHVLEDLQQPSLFLDPSFQAMKKAAIALRLWACPGGVNGTRQKAALGLERMDAIATEEAPTLRTWLLQPDPGVSFSTTLGAEASRVSVAGSLTRGLSNTLVVTLGDFRIEVSLRGNEDAEQIAKLIAKACSTHVLFEPELAREAPTPKTPQSTQDNAAFAWPIAAGSPYAALSPYATASLYMGQPSGPSYCVTLVPRRRERG